MLVLLSDLTYTHIMIRIIPVIAVVHKTEDNKWRGFCYPYDVACTVDTKEEAMEAITSLIETYEKVLAKYNHPRHLAENKLTDEGDQRVFNMLWPKITRQIADDVGKAKTLSQYSNSLSSRERTIKLDSNIVTYFNREVSPLFQ